MKESLTYGDVLIVPQFSTVRSRADVSTEITIADKTLSIPVLSSNMDTVCSPELIRAVYKAGGQGVLHRFMSIEENVELYKTLEDIKPWVSIGIGLNEINRAVQLHNAGADTFVIDVAHGASSQVVETYDNLRQIYKNTINIIVGNFDNCNSVDQFIFHCKSKILPDAIKVGIGPGSACTTRIVTGCGGGSISAIQDCRALGIPIIADGGITGSGDLAKAIGAGASAVMIGRLLAACEESPGETVIVDNKPHKPYRGSASKASYEVQGKVAVHREAEGEAYMTPVTGSVSDLMTSLSAGLRSAMSYSGAHTIREFQRKCKFVRVANATALESAAHGKKS